MCGGVCLHVWRRVSVRTLRVRALDGLAALRVRRDLQFASSAVLSAHDIAVNGWRYLSSGEFDEVDHRGCAHAVPERRCHRAFASICDSHR